jgi:glycosyltransferase involved in cell wall biosynthesis
MLRAAVVVHVHQAPDAFRATLGAVQAHTASPYELVVVADGAASDIEAELQRRTGIEIVRHDAPRGAPAILNRAFTERECDVVVLLESGSIPAPGWLDLLVAPLAAEADCGLTGPSTNMSWNEQCAVPGAGGTTPDVVAAAEQVRTRFGSATRTLEPLYSLADFCYAVHRRVFDAIGPADERYGLGPCWEMDYNVRAARAGIRGLWVCGAYVYRSPFTPRRRDLETQLFEANKRLYQNKFCGRQIKTPGTWYRPHCRGDECPEFAPRVKRQEQAPVEVAVVAPAPRPAPRIDVVPRESPAAAPGLVSCIMPTFNRGALVAESVRMFLAQDYPHRELIVVDDGTEPVEHLLPADERVRYFRLAQKLTIGAKRNFACRMAKGRFIAHWDDDDWFPPSRLSRQVRALEQSGADVCGTSEIHYYDPQRNAAYKYAYSGSPPWLIGLMYLRTLWERQPFEDIQIGEDTRFLWHPLPKRSHDLRDPSLYLARMHPGNTSPKVIDCSYWTQIPVDVVRPLTTRPTASCVMLTRNRRGFAALARELFEAQDYPDKELLIVDNGDVPVADLAAGNPMVRHIRPGRRLSLGELRSLAAREARGDIIVHWDDDDWYSPQRLRYQIAPILNGQADLTGLENRYMLDLSTGTFWTMSESLHLRMFVGNVHGGTLAFHRRILNGSVDYPPVNLAEDAGLLHRAMQCNRRLLRMPNPGMYVYVRHSRNTWQFQPGTFLDPSGWQTTRAPDVFPEGTLDRFRRAAAELKAEPREYEVTQWRR